MIEISVVARCTQRNTPISPIKGIVGGVSRERALQAIRNDLIGILVFCSTCCLIRGLNRRQHGGVQGLAPVSAEGSN